MRLPTLTVSFWAGFSFVRLETGPLVGQASDYVAKDACELILLLPPHPKPSPPSSTSKRVNNLNYLIMPRGKAGDVGIPRGMTTGFTKGATV